MIASPARAARIRIEDLSPVEQLTPEEMEAIYGSGWLDALLGPVPSKRLRRQVDQSQMVPAYVQTLECRVMLSGSAVASIANTQVIAYDVTTTGTFSYNMSTGAYSANVELPAGAKLDTSALKTYMQGSFAVPKVDPVQAVSAMAKLETNVTSNYEQVRNSLDQKYGAGNVYLASQRFFDWLSPKNIANQGAAAYLTGGATTKQIIQEARDVLLGELGNIYSWMKVKAPQEMEKMMAAMLESLVTGKEVNTPYFAVKFQNVNRTYTVGLGGAAARIAQGLGTTPPSKSVTEVCKGFSIIWKGPGTSLDSLAKSLNNFTGNVPNGATQFASVIAKLVNRPELKGLGPIVEAVLKANAVDVADQFVTSKLSSILGLTPVQVKQLYKPGSAVIDLRATQLDEKLAHELRFLAAGNEGSVAVTKMEVNLNSYEIEVQVAVRHRHSWGSVAEILKAVGRQVGQWADKAGNYVSQRTDAAGNTIRDVAYKGANKVNEVINAAGTLVSRTVFNSAGARISQAWRNGTKWIEQDLANGKVVAERLYEGAVQVYRKTWDTAGRMLSYVKWDAAGKTIFSAWRSGTKWIEQDFTNGKVVAERAYEGAVQVYRKTWDTAGNMLGYVKWDAAGKTIFSAWRTGTQWIEQDISAGRVVAERLWNNSVQVYRKTWNTAGTLLSHVKWDAAGKTIFSAWRTGTQWIEQQIANGRVIAEKMWNNSIQRYSRVWSAAGQLMSNTEWDAAGMLSQKAWRSGTRWIEQGIRNGRVVAERTWENGKLIADRAWNDAGKYLGDYLNKANPVNWSWPNIKI